jgi:hypothetical protein
VLLDTSEISAEEAIAQAIAVVEGRLDSRTIA